MPSSRTCIFSIILFILLSLNLKAQSVKNSEIAGPKIGTRQVHLDFHTSEYLEGIGEKFNKKEFQEAIKTGRINSINVFAKDWHGWSYYQTNYSAIHPHLKFDLLKAQIEACHEIDVKAPVYFAVGHAESEGVRHPGWYLIDKDGKVRARKKLPPGSPQTPRPSGTWTYLAPVNAYLDLIKKQTEEICQNYKIDGFWYDGVYTYPVAYNSEILNEMKQLGLDINNDDAVFKYGLQKWQQLMKDCSSIIKKYHPNASIFFNGTTFPHSPEKNIPYKNYQFNTQQELEDLPTTSWGWYDKFPLRSKLFHLTNQPIVAMSGKFHIGWGEFGGFKSAEAMKFEGAAMVAFGAACNFGDQLHPSGKMDMETYRLIGEAFKYVEEIEEFGVGGMPFSKLGVWFADQLESDEGITNMLLETQTDFVIIDPQKDLSYYETIIIPSGARLAQEETSKINTYIKKGGKVILISEAALNSDKTEFILNIGAKFIGQSQFDIDYTLALDSINKEIVRSPVLNYIPALRIAPESGTKILAQLFEPYFSRTYQKYSSHENTPPKTDPSIYPAVIKKGNSIFFATPIDKIYFKNGAKVHRNLFNNALKLIYKKPVLEVKMPSSARISLLHQQNKKRFVAHLLYAPPLKRGSVHVIEDIVPLYNIPVKLNVSENISSVYLIPGKRKLNFIKSPSGISIIVPKMEMHAGVVFEYK